MLRTLIDNCRTHFLNTLRLLPSHCWLLCDGRTALNAVIDAGAAIQCEDIVGNSQIFVGTLKLAAWNQKRS